MSDLHADEPDEEGRVGSLFDMSVAESQVGRHPLAALRQLIEKEDLRADVLLCAGDITNQAKPNPLQRAWPWLHRIRDALGATALVSTVGNHDLDSRHNYNDYDARGMIQAVATDLPVDNSSSVNEFWARHLCLTRVAGVTIVVLNTCAFHPESPEEQERGRISRYTLQRLRELLETEKDTDRLGPVGVLLCHHHPNAHPQMADDPDYEEMVRGAELLDFLGSGEWGNWLIVHGHKHVPGLYYAQGSASSPVVFAAGSLSARLYDTLQTRARNQFYVLDVRLSLVKKYGLVGSGRAWDFASGAGWAPADTGSGLPRVFGFGVRQSSVALASEVAEAVGEGVLEWDELRDRVPEVEFLLPADFRNLKRSLRSNHDIRVLESEGVPEQIGRRDAGAD